MGTSTQPVKVRSESQEGNGAVAGFVARVLSGPRRFRQFVHEVRVEMRQVTWPTREDVRATTLVVIAAVFFFGAYLAVVDRGVAWMVTELFKLFHP